MSQAILGGIIRVQGLYEDLNVRIPAGTSSHSVLTLSDRGFKRLDAYRGNGDHYVHLKIQVPVNLTQDQLKIVKDYAQTEVGTPGTITGVDTSSKAEYAQKKERKQREQKQKDEEEYIRRQREERAGDKTATEEETIKQQYEQSDKEETSGEEGFLTKLKKRIFG